MIEQFVPQYLQSMWGALTGGGPSKEEIATAEAELASAMAQLEAIRKMRHRA